MAKKLISDLERFHRSIIKTEAGCWEWQLVRDRDGYGSFKIGSATDGTKRQVRAHRWAYEQLVEPIHDGLQIDHKCCNPCCVNPDHLQAVTQLRNTQLGWERGTHVPHYTPLSSETKAKIGAKAKGRKVSEAVRQKMAASQRKRQQKIRDGLIPRPIVKASEETKLKISRAMRGSSNPFFGRTHSEEARRRISEARRAQKG